MPCMRHLLSSLFFFGSLHFTAPFRLKVHLLLITITTFGLVKKAISGGPSNKNTYIHTHRDRYQRIEFNYIIVPFTSI